MEALIDGMLVDVERFHREVLHDPPADSPRELTGAQRDHALEFLREELTEFEDARDLEGQADALVDIVYVALGRLIQMGLAPGAAFQVVHDANMRKERGEWSKRPHSQGVDAVKPEGWEPPKLNRLLRARAEDVAAVADLSPMFVACAVKREDRGEEYNVGGVQLEDYFPLGSRSHMQMMWVKALRARAITEVHDGNPPLSRVADSLIDGANYMSYWYEELIKEESL